MRQYRRPAYLVPTLSETGKGGKRGKRDRENFENGKGPPASFPDHWNEADVRGFLHAMQGFTCAYCNRQTNGLDVEHFRPKGRVDGDLAHGGYWWLAYELSNYVLGCTVCNQKRKSTRFPIERGAKRITYYNKLDLRDEKRILLDVVADPVENWLSIDWGDETAALIPNPQLPPAERARAQAVIDFFGLNSEVLVRRERSKAYEDAVKAAQSGDWGELAAQAMRHHPHSFVARFVLQQKMPARLPGNQLETARGVALLWRDLLTHIQQIRKRKERGGGDPVPQDHRTLESLAWALIILRDDPVIGAGPTVEQQLEDLLAAVADLRDQTAILAVFARLVAPSSF